MALADSALLEMIEMLRTADGGELMRRHRGPAIADGSGAARSKGAWSGRARCGNAPASTSARLSRSSLRLAKSTDGRGQVADLRGE